MNGSLVAVTLPVHKHYLFIDDAAEYQSTHAFVKLFTKFVWQSIMMQMSAKSCVNGLCLLQVTLARHCYFHTQRTLHTIFHVQDHEANK